MHATGSGFGPVLLIGVCVLLLHMLLFSLLTSVLITHLRRINGVAMLTSAQKAWQTTQRLVKRSASIMDTGSSTAAAGFVGLERVVAADLFGYTFDGLIVFNLVLLGLPSAAADDAANASTQELVSTVGVLVALAMAAEQVD